MKTYTVFIDPLWTFCLEIEAENYQAAEIIAKQQVEKFESTGQMDYEIKRSKY